jgi:hypothetical protein
LLEVQSGSVGGVVDFREESEDKLVFVIESESAGCDQQISDISSSLSGIGIEGEEGVKFLDVIGREDWVLGSDVFGEDGLEFFLLSFSL